MRIRYNAPVTLTMALLSALVLLAGQFLSQNFVVRFFSTPAPFNSRALLDYLKLFTHVLGHANIQHYIANFTMILLLGPILEAVYGSGFILVSVLLTALATGLANVLLFHNVILLGASGVVFMMIVLSSITNFQKGEVPLTFILVMIVYLGGQVWDALTKVDNISQFSHIIGGLVGSILGFFRKK